MIDALRAAAGTAAVREASAADAVHGVAPGVVVAPENADACAATLAACSERGWTVEVAGGRTARAWGRPTERVDVLLSAARMSGVAEYEPDDLTIGVAAGTTMSELRARVEQNRQRVPLDARSDRSTVGGVLARAAAGPMRRAWATPRRQTLGLELVTGDGRVLRVGGRVVKNVAGYDLNKLIVGSAGTLGVITRAHLRLLPIPNASATFAVAHEDASALIGVARALLAQPVEPAALELVGAPWRLVVRYEGAADAVSAGGQQMADAARAIGAAASRADDELAALAALESDAALVVRVADLPDRLDATLALAHEIAGGRGTIAAHAGDGIARVLLAEGDAAALDAAALARTIDGARAGAIGTVVVERAPAAVMRAVDPWGPMSDAVLRITRELKRQFDPAGILQPGRWLA